jgi:hypothetical protein
VCVNEICIQNFSFSSEWSGYILFSDNSALIVCHTVEYHNIITWPGVINKYIRYYDISFVIREIVKAL